MAAARKVFSGALISEVKPRATLRDTWSRRKAGAMRPVRRVGWVWAASCAPAPSRSKFRWPCPRPPWKARPDEPLGPLSPQSCDWPGSRSSGLLRLPVPVVWEVGVRFGEQNPGSLSRGRCSLPRLRRFFAFSQPLSLVFFGLPFPLPKVQLALFSVALCGSCDVRLFP